MLLPLDDHGFHRGDAVFEAARIHGGAYFDLMAHLKRLQTSARAIGMELPKSIDEIPRYLHQPSAPLRARDGRFAPVRFARTRRLFAEPERSHRPSDLRRHHENEKRRIPRYTRPA